MPTALFTSIVNDVYEITNRSDLVAETNLAVRQATLKLHQRDFYAKDLIESRVQFVTAAYYQSLAYASLFPSFRKLAYLRKFADGEAGDFLSLITPDNTFDSYGVSKEDICYLAGSVIQIRSSTSITDFLIGFYQNPTTNPELYDSWAANLYPNAVIAEAAAIVFKMIGYDEQASMYKAFANEAGQILHNTNVVAEAH